MTPQDVELPADHASEQTPGRVPRVIRAAFAAIMFLTRIPVPRWVGHDPDLLAGSTTFFPVVGLIVGLLGASVYRAAALLWPTMVAVTLAVAAIVWITGAFHEDALADACDGFGGGWERDQVLAIMKDSRVGSYGAVGVTLGIVARIVALVAIADAGGPGAAARALLVAHVLARWSSLPLIFAYPYVRETASKGRPFASSVTPARLVIGTALALGIALAVVDVAALPVFGVAIFVTALGGQYFRRRLGGITGDCLGAANQMVELACYLALAVHGAALAQHHGIISALWLLR